MNNSSSNPEHGSPFHSGEKFIQQQLGVAEKMERFGQQVIRNYMPDQHQQFYSSLPFVFVGHSDQQGWPWASILFNQPGFIKAVSKTQLNIHTSITPGDPLAKSLAIGNRLGLLGIELETRRRNRLAAHINRISENSIDLRVDQSFGNCPQYIQKRTLVPLAQNKEKLPAVEYLNKFDPSACDLISRSDTFFVASYIPNQHGLPSEGADVSHRGGKKGFIRIDDHKTLTIPDYLGNFHFNTLGNFLQNPKAGLLFIDFDQGHILTLTGTVEILWDSPDSKFFKSAERLWQFKIDHGFRLQNVLPWQFKLEEYSPNSILAGNWNDAKAAENSARLTNSWQPYTVNKVIQESKFIKSFYLQAPAGQKPDFKAGQFLTFKATINGKEEVRTYTVSSAPGDPHYRISVKQQGVFSNYLHQHINSGAIIQTKSPQGEFYFNKHSNRTSVLISAGVGITPMISMMRDAFLDSIRTRSHTKIIALCCARNAAERAFYQETQELEQHTNGQIKVIWILSQPEPDLLIDEDYQYQGRISEPLLESIITDQNHDVYLCGPGSFMQTQYDTIRKIGVPDKQIFAEAFGPASLTRDTESNSSSKLTVAEHAVITFAKSNLELAWSASDGTLLEFSEAHGLNPAYGCRNGQCGTCKVKLLSGKVSYKQKTHTDLQESEVLLCSAYPATDGNTPCVLNIDI